MERKNTITFYVLFSFLAITVISGAAQPVFAQSPGTMFGVAGNGSPFEPGALVTINPITGAQTLVADSINPGGLSGIGIDSSGRIWASTEPGLSQLERIHRTRGYGYESGEFVQSDLTRIRPQFRTLVQLRG